MQVSDIKHVEFELSSRCNAACPQCPRTLYSTKGINYELTDIKLHDIMDAIPLDLQPEIFKFSGNLGDPAVNPEVYEITSYFGKSRKNNVAINMHTNGGTRNENFWSKIGALSYEGRHAFPYDHKFRTKVIWAIDGLEDTNHLYRVGVEWTTLMRNLNAYLEAGGKAEWHFITFPWNEHQVDRAKDMAHNLGMTFVERRSTRNHIHKELKKEKNHKHVEEYEEAVKLATKSQYNILTTPEKKKFKSLTKNVSCQHLNFPGIFISSNFRVWPCCMIWDKTVHSPDFMKSLLPADPNWNSLRQNSLQEILDSEWYQKINTYWDIKGNNFIPTCVKMCAKKGSFRTSFTKFQPE